MEMVWAVPIDGNDTGEVSNKYRILVVIFQAERLFERSRHIRGIKIRPLSVNRGRCSVVVFVDTTMTL